MTNSERANSTAAEERRLPGRFEGGFSVSGGAREMIAALWDGLRLRCPSCGEGALYASKDRMNPSCPECGAAFERPSEGDFIGAIVTAYAFISSFVILLLLALNQYTQMDLMVQLAIAGGLSLALLFLFYRNIRGIWVAILVAVTKWLG